MSDKIKKLFKGLFSDMSPAKLFVLLMSFSTAIYFTIYLIIGNGFYTDMFFGNSRDFFMDFFNSIRDASSVDTVYTEAGVIYPPMANLIFLILSRFLPGVYNSTDFDDRYDWVKYSAPFMLVVITAMIFAIALHWIVRSNLDESNKRRAALFSIFAVFNVPVLYMIERGNILMFCFLSLLIYAFTYNSESKSTREIGLIALAFAFSLKLYPVIFGWILIRDKRFKDAIRCAIYGIAMIVLPAFAFGGFKVFGQVLDNIIRTLEEQGIIAETPYTFTTFNQRFLDECAGVFSNVALSVPVEDICADTYADFNNDFNEDFNIGNAKVY